MIQAVQNSQSLASVRPEITQTSYEKQQYNPQHFYLRYLKAVQAIVADWSSIEIARDPVQPMSEREFDLKPMSDWYLNEKISYFTQQGLENIQVYPVNHCIYNRDLQLYESSVKLDEERGNGEMIVMDKLGNIFIHRKERGILHHSSFFSGEPVAFAGLCFINDGKIKKLVTYSGHYSPTKKEQRSFFDQLSKICVVALDRPQCLNRPQCLIGIIHFFKPRSLEEIEIDEQKGVVQKISMYSYQKVTELYDKVSQVTGYCRIRLHLIAAGEDLSKGTTLEKTVMIKSGCIVSAFESRYAPYHPIVPVQHFKLMVIEPQFKDLDQF